MTHYLKFPNEKTAIQLLEKAGFLDEDKNIISCTHDYSIDVIGTITTGGEYDEEGNVITQPTTLPGWHINYAGVLPSDWEQYLVSPEEPVRVFF